MRFDNDGDYSDLCYLPYVICNFNDYANREEKYIGSLAVFKELCESCNIPTNSSLSLIKESKKYESDEFRQAFENHYGVEIEKAFNETLKEWFLYLHGRKDEMDVEMLSAIEEWVYNNKHPEIKSFYKSSYEYNKHWYGNILACTRKEFPDLNYKTFAGGSIPEDALIIMMN